MLLDSNIIIYSAQPDHHNLRQFINSNSPFVSWVNYVEVLGYHKLSKKDEQYFELFFKASSIIEIDFEIIERATKLRQNKIFSLGDALIAATAVKYDLILVTANTVDFKGIKGLRFINPLK